MKQTFPGKPQTVVAALTLQWTDVPNTVKDSKPTKCFFYNSNTYFCLNRLPAKICESNTRLLVRTVCPTFGVYLFAISTTRLQTYLALSLSLSLV